MNRRKDNQLILLTALYNDTTTKHTEFTLAELLGMPHAAVRNAGSKLRSKGLVLKTGTLLAITELGIKVFSETGSIKSPILPEHYQNKRKYKKREPKVKTTDSKVTMMKLTKRKTSVVVDTTKDDVLTSVSEMLAKHDKNTKALNKIKLALAELMEEA